MDGTLQDPQRLVHRVQYAIHIFHMENDPASDQLPANLNLPITQPLPILDHFFTESTSL